MMIFWTRAAAGWLVAIVFRGSPNEMACYNDQIRRRDDGVLDTEIAKHQTITATYTLDHALVIQAGT